MIHLTAGSLIATLTRSETRLYLQARKVVGLIPAVVIGSYNIPDPSSRTRPWGLLSL
jgi:hypothetical protein